MRALLLFVLLAASCLGTRARSDVLVPAMRNAWPGIVRILDGPEAMSAALLSGSVARVLSVNWTLLQLRILRRIDERLAEGEIGPGVAASLRERVRVFDEAYRKLGRQ